MRTAFKDDWDMSKTAHNRVAVITGVTGQDGSYLAELLLERGYCVHGIVRDRSRLGNIAHLRERLHLHQLDLRDSTALGELVRTLRPAELYHLASTTFVPLSWQAPAETTLDMAGAMLAVLEAMRDSSPHTRLLLAGSSEMFGTVDTSPQNEATPFRPRNPYGTAKVFAHHLLDNYRQHYGLFAATAILFNHESPRRGAGFVTRKISTGVARIALGLQSRLTLGDLSASRDWGYAADFVDAMHRMLQLDEPRDFVIGTGRLTTVGQLVEFAFSRFGLDWKNHVDFDSSLVRRGEVQCHLADPSAAHQHLGWTPTTPLEQVMRQMVDHDWNLASRTSAAA
jgi:GDPmannose 4,6-dehydratase